MVFQKEARLLRACRTGDVDKATQLLATISEAKPKLLAAAIANGNYDICGLLLNSSKVLKSLTITSLMTELVDERQRSQDTQAQEFETAKEAVASLLASVFDRVPIYSKGLPYENSALSNAAFADFDHLLLPLLEAGDSAKAALEDLEMSIDPNGDSFWDPKIVKVSDSCLQILVAGAALQEADMPLYYLDTLLPRMQEVIDASVSTKSMVQKAMEAVIDLESGAPKEDESLFYSRVHESSRMQHA